MSQSGHAPRRPVRRARGQPRRLLPHVVRLRRPRARACSSGCARRARAASRAAELAAAHRDEGRPGPALGVGRGRRTTSCELDGDRIVLFDEVAAVLLDADRPEYLGGQFLHAAIGSLDFDVLPDVFRTGGRARSRPDRYRMAIERLTVQDVAVFFQEVLRGAAAARRRPRRRRGDRRRPLRRRPLADRDGPAVPGHAPGRRRVRGRTRSPAPAPTSRRPACRTGSRSSTATSASVGHAGEMTLAYFQYALHQLADPAGAIASAWQALRPGGWLVALDWYLPTDPDELRTRHARADRRRAARRARPGHAPRDALRGARLVRDGGRPGARR